MAVLYEGIIALSITACHIDCPDSDAISLSAHVSRVDRMQQEWIDHSAFIRVKFIHGTINTRCCILAKIKLLGRVKDLEKCQRLLLEDLVNEGSHAIPAP